MQQTSTTKRLPRHPGSEIVLWNSGTPFALVLCAFLCLDIPKTNQSVRRCLHLLHHQAVHQLTEILLLLLDQLDGSLIANGLEEMLFVGVAYVKRCCLSEERVVVSTLHLLGY